MRVVLTGSSGRLGRAIFGALARLGHDIVGIDRTPFSTTCLTGDIGDHALLARAMEGADAVIHCAALHAPHVGLADDESFERVNVAGTRSVASAARAAGIGRFVFTSTTALYGHAIARGACTWIDEDTPPQPRTIYHRTKLAAEGWLQEQAGDGFRVRVLRMSRSFPEPADRMAIYRLHRGIDVRDVADAHVLALTNDIAAFQRYVISGASPFAREDCAALASDPQAVVEQRAGDLAALYRARGWRLPATIDRIYSPAAAQSALGWQPRFGFEEVVRQLDSGDLEVLPVGAPMAQKPE